MKENEFALSISRDSFYKTSMLIYDNFGFNIEYSFSLIVNEAITCELSIKAMLEKLNIAYSKSHAFFDLLSMLPAETQNEIVNTISNVLKHPRDTVIKDIQILSYAVVDWRYLDKTMVIEFNTLHQLMLILYKLSKKSVFFEITKVENTDVYFIEYMYNYGKIEAFVKENEIKSAIINMSNILSSLKFNRTVLETLIGNKVLDYKEDTYDVMKPKGSTATKDTYLEYEEKYGVYEGYGDNNDEDNKIEIEEN